MNRPDPIPLVPDRGSLQRAAVATLHRACAARMLADIHEPHDQHPERIAAEKWPNDANVPAVLRAAVNPATMATAASLVRQVIPSFLALLAPVSAAAALFNECIALQFGEGVGAISLPKVIPPSAGTVVEGQPIPVVEAVVDDPIILHPKKNGVIATLTREMVSGSANNIETIIGAALREAAAQTLDSLLLGSAAESTSEPAGILHGIGATTASTATPLSEAMADDLSSLAGTVARVAGGPIVYVMAPEQSMSVAVRCPGFDYTVLSSAALTAGTVICLAPSALAAAVETTPRIDSNIQSTLHMNTTPLPLASGPQGSGVVATPTRNLWQSDTVGIRLLLPIAWAMRAPAVAWIQNVSW